MGLFLGIKYDIKKDEFTFHSDIKEERQVDILEAVVRMQIGAGVDNSKANDLNVYLISIDWDLSDDSFSIKSNTGNKGLTTGIIMQAFKKLSNTASNKSKEKN